MKERNHDIEKKFRDAFNGYEEPVFESDWQQIAAALPEKRKRPLFWLYLLPFALAGTLVWWAWSSNQASGPEQPVSAQLLHPESQNRTSPENEKEVRIVSNGSGKGQPVPEIASNKKISADNTQSSVHRRTDTYNFRDGVESESQKGSTAGSNSHGGGTGQINDELREFKGELLPLEARKIQLAAITRELARFTSKTIGPYQAATDGYRRLRGPALWIETGLSAMRAGDLMKPAGNDWNGKSLKRNSTNSGLTMTASAGIAVPLGLSAVQFGIGQSENMIPMKQHWTLRTRMVTDSIPYRNMPGDTLFWIPVKFTDTLIDVVTEFSEKRLIIPFRFAQHIPLNTKFGLNIQTGGQLGILQSIRATIPSPFTDYTYSQVLYGMAGNAKTNAPVAVADNSSQYRTRFDLSAGIGAYLWVNRNLMLNSNFHVSGGLKPLMRSGGAYMQTGGALTLMYLW